MRSPSAGRAVQRAFFALGLSLGLTGQALSLGHHLLTRHTACAEHGELEHVAAGASEHAEHARPSASAAASAGTASYASAGSELEDAHEHCAAPGERRALVSVSAADAVCVATATCDSALRAATAHRAIAQLYLAPKCSPPA